MRRHVLSNLDDLGQEARKVAEAAARRAGLSLEDWAAALIAKDAGRQDPAPNPEHRADKRTGLLAGADLRSVVHDALIQREGIGSFPKVRPISGGETAALRQATAATPDIPASGMTHQPAVEDREALMAAAAAESERRAYERHSGVAAPAGTAPRWNPQRAAPAELPVQEAIKALAPLPATLTSLRTDVSRLARRLEQPAASFEPAVGEIRAEIERLQSTMGGLATREEVAALDRAIREVAKGIARDLEQGHSSKDLLTLASAVAALYRQAQSLSDEVTEGMHRRIGAEIDLIKHKVDRIAETGVDRSVIDFLSSQIVDLRHDLTHRIEPQQLERLSKDIAALDGQLAEIRASQVGRLDIANLKTSLEDVCSALNRTIAAQEESDVPEQLQSMSQRLDALVNRPETAPANLDPITEQLALLTERMADLSTSRLDQADALAEMIGRLSTQVQAMAGKEAPSHEPLMERFDRIEQELRQVGHQANTSTVERMLRSIDERLGRTPAQPLALDALEKQIMDLAARLTEGSNEPLHKALDEATGHLRDLKSEAVSIAERAAKAALNDIRPSLPDTGDLDALKQGLIELKALQSRADKKTQQTLQAVHEALGTLVSRFPDQSAPLKTASQGAPQVPSESLPPADRLEAAVRRLHAATLSQIENASGAPQEAPAPAPQPADVKEGPQQAVASTLPAPDEDLGAMRASFIAAARRAAQNMAPEDPAPPSPLPLRMEEIRLENEADETVIDDNPLSPPSLIARIRRTFESHRRPLLFSLGLLILAAGTAQILAVGKYGPSFSSAQATEAPKKAMALKQESSPEAKTGSIAMKEADLFQASNLTDSPIALTSAKFIVDPATLGTIPPHVPAALRQAALSGDAAAVYEIASRAADGRDAPQDTALATRLFERAAQAGLPPAQERFALLHEKGLGVPRDLKQAAAWYERAAQGGNIRAMHNLATLLASGINGKPDYAAALRWYGEAAESGWRDSQFNMGVLLARGVGTRQDLPNAFKWFSLAARQGDTEAGQKRDEIAARLEAADLKAAQEALGQWRARAVEPVANEAPSPAKGRTASLDRTTGGRS